MNRKKLPELKGKRVRPRPTPRRFDVAGNELPRSDQPWFVSDANRDGLVIENSGFGHTLLLPADQIHDFRTDPSGKSFGFLNLHGQIWVRGRDGGVEPLVYGRQQTPNLPTPPVQTVYSTRQPWPAVPFLILCGLLLCALEA